MTKIKTYVLTVSRYFPTYHSRKGEETGFVEKILSGEKIHTIRGNLVLWARRIEAVKKGEAILSIRYWSGKPYNSPQVEFKQITFENMPSVQSVDYVNYELLINDTLYDIDFLTPIAENDGLKTVDFFDWFGITKGKNIEGVIIHFTDFRY